MNNSIVNLIYPFKIKTLKLNMLLIFWFESFSGAVSSKNTEGQLKIGKANTFDHKNIISQNLLSIFLD